MGRCKVKHLDPDPRTFGVKTKRSSEVFSKIGIPREHPSLHEEGQTKDEDAQWGRNHEVDPSSSRRTSSSTYAQS